MLGTDDPRVNQAVLDGMLQNVRNILPDLGDGFQQICGPFSPRPGYGVEDGIGFTDETAGLVSRHLRRHDIRVAWLVLADEQMHSLIIAGTDHGLQRGLRAAKKAAHQIRGRLEIRLTPRP
jgi:hypothetical protein